MTVITILEEEEEEENLPLTLDQVKSFLKIDYEEDTAEDEVILRAFKAAINQCETKINKSIIGKTYFLSTYGELKNDYVRLFYGTVTKIKNVKALQKNGEITVIDSSQYFLDSRMDFLFFSSVPTNFRRLDIIYKAKLAQVSEEILQAILFHLAKIYEDKTGYGQIPRASLNIYKKYRDLRI